MLWSSAVSEGSSSWTLGEYAVSIRSDLRSTASSLTPDPCVLTPNFGDRPHETLDFIGYRGACPQKWCPLLTSAADYEIIVNHKTNQ